MKRIGIPMLALAGALAMFGGCSEEEAPPPPPPAAPKIPPYEPTGDHADVKKEAAKGITADNALEKAKALEAELDQALASP